MNALKFTTDTKSLKEWYVEDYGKGEGGWRLGYKSGSYMLFFSANTKNEKINSIEISKYNPGNMPD